MANSDEPSKLMLGKSDIRVSPVGMGAWAWGASGYWGRYSVPDLEATYEAARAGGIDFIDTAEAYGMGRSERFIGQFLAKPGAKPIVATKFFPFPWRIFKGQLIGALRASIRRLGVQRVDLYQLHWPLLPLPLDTWVMALGDAIEMNLIRMAGVSNYNVRQTRRAHDLLAARGMHLTSNQVHFSLLYRRPEKSGLLDLCKSLGVTVIAYSPLEQGVLTGKYTPTNLPPGVRRRRYTRNYLALVQPLIGLLREIGRGHGGKTAGQVAINWAVAKGTLPIPGARNRQQAEEIVGTLGWSLTPEEVSVLDQASDQIPHYPSASTLESMTYKV